MNDEIKEAIAKLKEIKSILEKFSTKEEGVEFLVKETKLSKEECTIAYDLYMKMNLDK